MSSLPGKVVAAVTVLALVVLGGVGVWLALTVPRVLLALVLLAAGGGLARLYVGVLAYYNKHARLETIKADKVIDYKRAEVQIAPLATSLHHAPHITVPTPPALAEPPALPAPEPRKPPTFSALLRAGDIGPGHPLILGYDAATCEPMIGGWSKLYSVGVGGLPGSGKSWLCAFLLAQSVAASSARLIVIDPHAGDPESLSDRLSGLAAALKYPIAQTPTQIERALTQAAKELAGRINGSPTPHPIILVCDEWTSLLRGRMGELLTTVALDYAEQGRKFGCFAMLAAQGWQIATAGPVRDRLASHYIMHTRPDQFRYQTGMRGAAEDTLRLKPKEAYFLSVAGELTKVIIPDMAPADLARVGDMIDKPASVSGRPFGIAPVTGHVTPSAELVTARRQAGDIAVTSAQDVTTASGRQNAPLSPEAARAGELLLSGDSIPSIVYKLRGVQPRQGRPYMTALAEVTILLREAMGGGQ